MAINFDPFQQPASEIAASTERSNEIRLRHKLSAAAVSALGPADMALSDGLFAKTYAAISENLSPFQSELLNRMTHAGALSGVVFTQSFLLSVLVAREPTVQDSFNAFKKFEEKRQKEMSLGRRAVSRVVTSPLAAIGWVGEKIGAVGEKVASSDIPKAEIIGALITDIGNTNALGTTTTTVNESMRSEKPIPIRRSARLAAVITGSWLATAEAIRGAYRGIGSIGKPGEAIQNGIGAFARTLDTLTTVGTNPMETPVGSLFMGAVVGSLAVTGWKIAEMQQQGASAPELKPLPSV